MTHEYVIGLGGRIDLPGLDTGDTARTAIAWAADRVLAVGRDEVVCSVSRGDSTFLDLGGCVVTALPDDPVRADTLVRQTTFEGARDIDLGALLVGAGLLAPDATLEPGSPADMAFWGAVPGSGGPEGRPALRLVAIVREGVFSEGDEHRGPFPAARGS